MSRKAFTLIELLVSVLILAVLIAILLPAISGARLSARSTKCLANLRQLAIPIALYAQNNHRFPRTEEVADASLGNLTLPRLVSEDAFMAALPDSWKCPRDDEWAKERSSYSFLPARFMRPPSDNADYRPSSDDEGLDTPQGIYRTFEQSSAIPILEDALRFHVTNVRREALGQTTGFEGVQAAYLDGSARQRK